MKFIDIIERFERIDNLIRIKATGKPKNFARKLNISERCLYNTIEIMKQLGAPISFSRLKESYVYEYDVEFKFKFIKKINKNKTAKKKCSEMLYICNKKKEPVQIRC